MSNKVDSFAQHGLPRQHQPAPARKAAVTSKAPVAQDLPLPAAPTAVSTSPLEAPVQQAPGARASSDASGSLGASDSDQLLQMLQFCGNADQLNDMTPNQVLDKLNQLYPGSSLITGLQPADLDALVSQLDDMNRREKKEMQKAEKDLAKGDIKDARKHIKRALRRAGGKKLRGDELDAEVEMWLKKLAPAAELANMSPKQIADQLRASYPGAAPVLDQMTPGQLLQVLSRMDLSGNATAQADLSNAQRYFQAGDLANAQSALDQVEQDLGIGDSGSTSRDLKQGKKDLKKGKVDAAADALDSAGPSTVARTDISNGQGDLSGALASMGRN